MGVPIGIREKDLVGRALLLLVSMQLVIGCTAVSTNQKDTLLTMQASIEIEAPIEQVFKFASNPLNDHHWRTEVQEIVSDGPLRIGTNFTEFAHLGFVRRYKTPVTLTSLHQSDHIRVSAPASHSRKFTAERIFHKTSDTSTRLIHRVFADRGMIMEVMYIPISPEIAKARYQSLMQGYLARLKILLEG